MRTNRSKSSGRQHGSARRWLVLNTSRLSKEWASVPIYAANGVLQRRVLRVAAVLSQRKREDR